MRMRIRKVKVDYSDLTISVPINTLGAFAGDFDGDALNSMSLKDAELTEAYELFDPRTHMIVSKNDGLFDNNFNLIKDQLICLHQFCKFGKVTVNIRKIKNKSDNEILHKVKVKKVKDKKHKVKIKKKK